MLEAGVLLQERFPELRFGLVCPGAVRPVVDEILRAGELGVRVLDTDAATLAAAAELCITKSGTITLEIASQGTPMVIFYRLNPVLYFLALGVTDAPYIGLINNLAGQMICPEKAMPRPDPRWVVKQAGRLLGEGGEYARCRREIERALEGFAEPGASARAASAILGLV
jgi:lipid-A-disaccharide synthase